ncbi:MAG: ABC transporter substrate-binding protein [Bradyrhizobium sp.]|jgi:putative ABC transport system substrate-binding protein
MRRRNFIKLMGGVAVAWPLAVRAQQPAMPVIGFLSSGSAGSSNDGRIVGFSRGLNESGFMEGRNVTIQYHFAEGHYDRMPAMVADFVSRKVAVVAAMGGVNTALAAKPASATIPVVFANGSDPVQFGLVESLNRPGGNMTGVSFFTATLEAKRLGLLFELVPTARIFGVLVNPTNDNAETQLKDIAQGGLTLSRPMTVLKASDEREIEAAFETFAQQQANVLLVAADPYFYSQRETIVALAARYHLPAIYEWREFAQAGGLASYGTNNLDDYRLAGIYVGRVLKGEKPADLPVMRATKFEFVINLKTAKALGIDVAPMLSARADEVIE